MDTLHKILDMLWKKGISEIDFCNSIGINKSAVTDWKRGKTTSYRKHLPQIADFLDVSVDYLLGIEKQVVLGGGQQVDKELEPLINSIVERIHKMDSDNLNAMVKYADFLISQQKQ